MQTRALISEPDHGKESCEVTGLLTQRNILRKHLLVMGPTEDLHADFVKGGRTNLPCTCCATVTPWLGRGLRSSGWVYPPVEINLATHGEILSSTLRIDVEGRGWDTGAQSVHWSPGEVNATFQ